MYVHKRLWLDSAAYWVVVAVKPSVLQSFPFKASLAAHLAAPKYLQTDVFRVYTEVTLR